MIWQSSSDHRPSLSKMYPVYWMGIGVAHFPLKSWGRIHAQSLPNKSNTSRHCLDFLTLNPVLWPVLHLISEVHLHNISPLAKQLLSGKLTWLGSTLVFVKALAFSKHNFLVLPLLWQPEIHTPLLFVGTEMPPNRIVSGIAELVGGGGVCAEKLWWPDTGTHAYGNATINTNLYNKNHFLKNEKANTIFSSARSYEWLNLFLLSIILEMMVLNCII